MLSYFEIKRFLELILPKKTNLEALGHLWHVSARGDIKVFSVVFLEEKTHFIEQGAKNCVFYENSSGAVFGFWRRRRRHSHAKKNLAPLKSAKSLKKKVCRPRRRENR